jgi:hypothetical protein
LQEKEERMYIIYLALAIPGLIVVFLLFILFQSKGNRIVDILKKNTVSDINALKIEIEKNKLSINTSNTHVALMILGVLLTFALPVAYLYIEYIYSPQVLKFSARIDTELLNNNKFYVEGPDTEIRNDAFSIPILKKNDCFAISVNSNSDKYAGLTIIGDLDIDKGYFNIRSPSTLKRSIKVEKNSIDLTQFDDMLIKLQEAKILYNKNNIVNQSLIQRKSDFINLSQILGGEK